MFENCADMAQLNEARINAIKEGNPAILVNKEYARRKAQLLSGEARGFKRVGFVPVPVIEPEYVAGIDFAYESDPTTIIISTAVMNG